MNDDGMADDAADTAQEPDAADAGEGDDEPPPGTELLASTVQPPGPACPSCSAPRPAEGRFCERCGVDFVTADVPPPARWTAEILADQQQFTRVGPDGLEFPGAREVVTLTLTAPELLIGRRHERRGIEPAIDLSGPLGDPAASHRHAVLTRLDDGAYAVTDLGSTNGTDLNDGRVTIEPGRSYRLGNGDRIHIGAWTTIIVRQSS